MSWPPYGTNPPACFFNAGGIQTLLNQNPQYKKDFLEIIGGPVITSTISTLGYDVAKVPLCPNVVTLNSNQAKQYNTQLNLFRKVYTYNSNAYIFSQANGTPPIYYNFRTYTEYNDYKSATALVNKLYSFDVITKLWVFPFPVIY